MQKIITLFVYLSKKVFVDWINLFVLHKTPKTLLIEIKIIFNLQKQSPEVFYKKGILTNFAKFTGKNLSLSLFLVKLQA